MKKHHYRDSKPKLPKAPKGVPELVEFSRADFTPTEPDSAVAKLPRKVELTQCESELKEVALKLKQSLEASEPNKNGLYQAQGREVSDVSVTQAKIWRAVQAFDLLDSLLQSLEIRPGYLQDSEEMVYSREQEWVKIRIFEHDDGETKGCFECHVSSSGWIEGRSLWRESKRQPIEWIIPNMARRIDTILTECYTNRLEREREQEERRRQRAVEQHPKIIQEHKDTIVANLERATYWWTRSEELRRFLEATETRWKEAQDGKLSPEQDEWIRWASEAIEGLSPCSRGYPNLEGDGPADYDKIEIGGPYPDATNLPAIPSYTLKDKSYDGFGYRTVEKEYQYPFWLKHQK